MQTRKDELEFLGDVEEKARMAHTVFGMMYSQLLQERFQKEGRVSVNRRMSHDMDFYLDIIKINAKEFGIKCKVRQHKKHTLITLYADSSFVNVLEDTSIILPEERDLLEA